MLLMAVVGSAPVIFRQDAVVCLTSDLLLAPVCVMERLRRVPPGQLLVATVKLCRQACSSSY